ncbi:MAG: hypothetical protein PHP39_04565, partial [Oscillospiraceae bacterium]|nr:hypothetical protein [Oscillospiraceae bacterium]
RSIIRSEQPSGTGHTKTIQDFAALLLSIFQECGLGRVVAGIKPSSISGSLKLQTIDMTHFAESP